MKNSILALMAFVALTSCAALGQYTPETEVAQDKFGDCVSAGQDKSIAEISWQEMFSDKYLQDYIREALANNNNLRAAEERIRQAEISLTGAKLSYTPTLGLSPVFATDFKGNQLENTTYAYKLNAAASWQLTPMRIANGVKSAQATLDRTEYARRATLSQVVCGVANAYYALLMLDAQLLTARQMEETWAKSLETIKAMKEAGMADQVAVSQYQANYDKICISVLTLLGQIKASENALCLLVGTESKHGIPRGTLVEQTIPKDLSVGLPVKMLALRPDVQMAEKDMELAFYTTKGALLNFFPALTINGQFGLVNPVTGAISPMTLLAEVGAGLVAPIFKAGVNRTALKNAESRQREARIVFDQTLLSACKEVNDYYGMYNTAAQSTSYYDSQVTALDKARKDTEYLMMNSFDKTYLDVLYANNSYFDAVISMIANKTKQMQAYIGLYAALGGGSF